MVKKSFLIFFIYLIFLGKVFSQKIISPVEGRFSNKQTLIIDLKSGEEAFYSFSNTDPLEAGFAYDGPALIDLTGDIALKVKILHSETAETGEIEEICEDYEIKYSVIENNPFQKSSDEAAFIEKINLTNIFPCNSENEIAIPESLYYSMGNEKSSLIKGKTLRIHEGNALYRYIPCSVTDGESLWRFIIFISPSENNLYEKKSFPFEISDWSKFRFTGKNLIWAIDDGFWSGAKDEINIDRSQSHIIYWQDVAYNPENPVYSFVLPPEPEFIQSSEDKAISFSLSGDQRYELIFTPECEDFLPVSTSAPSSLFFDTLDGDSLSQNLSFEVYCDGLYQGKFISSCEIDKKPPLSPEFIASEPGQYSRHDITLTLKGEEESEIYFTLSGPHLVSSVSYSENENDSASIDRKSFIPYENQKLFLPSGGSKKVSYQLFAYSRDKAGNESDLASYKVTIDAFNYYIDESAEVTDPDGSALKPFTSFEDVLNLINQEKFVHFFINGSLTLPEGISTITSNCSFTGLSQARLIIPPSGALLVKDSSLEIQNCIIQKEILSPESDNNIFIGDAAVISFEDCKIYGNFHSSGKLFSVEKSVLEFKNSALIVNSPVYSCAISGNNSDISLSASYVSSISNTAVNFSLRGGSFKLDSCDCKVFSNLGRIIEAAAVNLRLSNNNYEGKIEGKGNSSDAIWKDKDCLILEDKNNKVLGF